MVPARSSLTFNKPSSRYDVSKAGVVASEKVVMPIAVPLVSTTVPNPMFSNVNVTDSAAASLSSIKLSAIDTPVIASVAEL